MTATPPTAPSTTGQTPPVALTIAASDSGGGAGIQADLKTFAAHGVFGTSVLTAVTAQNTRGVHAIEPTSPAMIEAQLVAVADDLDLRSVKTGMLASTAVIELLAEHAPRLPNLVIDPVLVSSSGRCLCSGPAAPVYRRLLFPHATVVTPNLAEAGALLGREITTVEQAVAAARELGSGTGSWIVVTGGHLGAEPVDVVWHAGEILLLGGQRIETRNDHGTGCVFSAAIAARLALGESPQTAIVAAKTYTRAALVGAAAWRLGSGVGPLSWGTNDLARTIR